MVRYLKYILKEYRAFTLTIAIICSLIFLICQTKYLQLAFQLLLYFDSEQINQDLIIAEPWRLITPSITHINILHVLFNVSWWLIISNIIEKKFGKIYILALFFIGGIISNYCQYYFTGHNLFIGLSGVIYALVGFCWAHQLKTGHSIIDPNAIKFMIGWMIICLTGIIPINIGNASHVSGFVSGILMGLVTIKRVKYI